MRRSETLNKVLAELLKSDKHDDVQELLHITTGYDNDGSTGIDMVEIGIGLGVELAAMRAEKGEAYVWLATHPNEHQGWPIVAASEEEAIAVLMSL